MSGFHRTTRAAVCRAMREIAAYDVEVKRIRAVEREAYSAQSQCDAIGAHHAKASCVPDSPPVKLGDMS